MRSSLPTRCILIGFLAVGLTGCHTTGQWTSRHWSTSAWNPSTWAMGTRPEAPSPSLASTNGYPAKPSLNASPTGSGTSTTAAPYGPYPTTGSQANGGALAQGYPGGNAFSSQKTSSTAGGAPYMAPQAEPYAAQTNWSQMPSTPPRMQPAIDSSYAGSPSATGSQGNPFRPTNTMTNGSGYPYDAQAGYGAPVNPAPPYGGSPTNASMDTNNSYQNSLMASRTNQAGASYSPPGSSLPAAPTMPSFGSSNEPPSPPVAPYPLSGGTPTANSSPNGNISAYKNGAVNPVAGYAPIKNGSPVSPDPSYPWGNTTTQNSPTASPLGSSVPNLPDPAPINSSSGFQPGSTTEYPYATPIGTGGSQNPTGAYPSSYPQNYPPSSSYPPYSSPTAAMPSNNSGVVPASHSLPDASSSTYPNLSY